MMEKLQSRIDRELRFQQDLMKLRGALDMTLAQVRSFNHNRATERRGSDKSVCSQSGRSAGVVSLNGFLLVSSRVCHGLSV